MGQGTPRLGKLYEALDVVAKLNVLADQLAVDHNKRYGQFCPQACILPSCPAQLSIQGVSVTGKYNKQIVQAYTEPRYAAYLMQRFEWRDGVFGSISWESFWTAMQRISRDTVLTKICNDILPTIKRL